MYLFVKLHGQLRDKPAVWIFNILTCSAQSRRELKSQPEACNERQTSTCAEVQTVYSLFSLKNRTSTKGFIPPPCLHWTNLSLADWGCALPVNVMVLFFKSTCGFSSCTANFSPYWISFNVLFRSQSVHYRVSMVTRVWTPCPNERALCFAYDGSPWEQTDQAVHDITATYKPTQDVCCLQLPPRSIWPALSLASCTWVMKIWLHSCCITEHDECEQTVETPLWTFLTAGDVLLLMSVATNVILDFSFVSNVIFTWTSQNEPQVLVM